MRSILFFITIWLLPFIPVISQAQQKYPGVSKLNSPGEVSIRLPDDVMPVLGCWFWTEEEFEPFGYQKWPDLVSKYSPYNLLTTSFRIHGKELTDPDFHNQVKLGAQYAIQKGIRLAIDLDVRLARRVFEAKYPDELQEMLILQEVEFSENNTAETVVYSQDLNDHYTVKLTPYIPLNGSPLAGLCL